MSGEQRQILFSGLWNKLPPTSARIWRHPRGREVLELLCSALWHLELAAEIGGGFSTVAMKDLPGGADPPWQEWLNQTPILSVQSTANQLVMCYSFPGPLNLRLNNLLQTMLLANAALRLAGAQDILSHQIPSGRHTAILGEDYISILQSDGNFKIPPPCSPYKRHIFKNLLLVVAFQDSIMHGEIPTGARRRRKFRDLWIDGRLNRNRPKYSSAKIAQACRGVWEKLVPCVKRL